MKQAPTIRPLAPDEAALLVDWAADEGWNPGHGDAAAFHAADPQGFLGAFVAGELAAGIAAVAYGERFGFIGLYICRPDRRGRGYGKAVWNAGIARLEGRTIGLDGVPGQQANYRRMGFAAAYRTLRFSGPLAATGDSSMLRPIETALLPEIMAYDASCFPAARPGFLEAWLSPPRLALLAIQDGRLRGYGAARACREGHKIGPLFADDATIAERLLLGLAAASGAEAVHVDVPEGQAGFIDRLMALGPRPGFETARMYAGTPPVLAAEKIFGITTLELG